MNLKVVGILPLFVVLSIFGAIACCWEEQIEWHFMSFNVFGKVSTWEDDSENETDEDIEHSINEEC